MPDEFAEWPPANYRTISEDEEMEIADSLKEMPVGIGSAGILRNGHPPTWPGYIDNRRNGECDCGGWHSESDCPNRIVEWNGWQA